MRVIRNVFGFGFRFFSGSQAPAWEPIFTPGSAWQGFIMENYHRITRRSQAELGIGIPFPKRSLGTRKNFFRFFSERQNQNQRPLGRDRKPETENRLLAPPCAPGEPGILFSPVDFTLAEGGFQAPTAASGARLRRQLQTHLILKATSWPCAPVAQKWTEQRIPNPCVPSSSLGGGASNIRDITEGPGSGAGIQAGESWRVRGGKIGVASH